MLSEKSEYCLLLNFYAVSNIHQRLNAQCNCELHKGLGTVNADAVSIDITQEELLFLSSNFFF